MNVEVENTPTLKKEVNSIFVEIISIANSSSSEIELREKIKDAKETGIGLHFEIGFGHNHMWVHEKIKGKVGQRLMIVRF